MVNRFDLLLPLLYLPENAGTAQNGDSGLHRRLVKDQFGVER